jgi:hypothetical protein
MTLRRREASTPVTACGYMNSASAEPRASEEYAHTAVGPTVSEPNGLPVFGVVVARCEPAVEKMWLQPPSLPGCRRSPR